MKIERFFIDGPKLIVPNIYNDSRGFFMETFKSSWFKENVENVEFVQDNQSLSNAKNTIRGLHFQKPPFEQGKLVRCLQGAIYDVAVDIRPNSKTFGKYISVNLTSENHHQLWIPAGFAHGFCTLEINTIVSYKVTDYYAQEFDCGIKFDDEKIAIKWPIENLEAIISQKDANLPYLSSA